MKNKPTSKVIQISEIVHLDTCFITVLCEDGSIWEKEGSGNKVTWTCILEPHREIESLNTDELGDELLPTQDNKKLHDHLTNIKPIKLN